MFSGIRKSVSGILIVTMCCLITSLTAIVCDAEDVYGDVYVTSGQTFQVSGGGTDVYGSVFNQGTVFVAPFNCFWAEEDIENSGLIQVFNADCTCHEVFRNLETGQISACGVVSSGEGIHNLGLLQSLGGSLLVATGGEFSNSGTLKNNPGASLTIVTAEPVVDNQGIVEAASDGAVVFDCNLANEPNGVIRLFGGTLAAKKITQKLNAILSGFGGITGDLVIDADAEVKLSGSTNIVGHVQIADGATLEINDGNLLITGQTICNGTIHIKGGRIVPQGGLSGDCNIISEPSDYNMEDLAFLAETWLWQNI